MNHDWYHGPTKTTSNNQTVQFSLLDLTTTRPPNQRTILPNVPPRNDFVANASVSPDYTPFDATFQDRTTFIHHGAYHVAWMFLMGVPRILEMLQLLWNDFWTCTKQMLKTNVLAKVSKYPSLALKVLVLLWDNFELVSSFGSFRYLTPTNYRLTPLPRPRRNYESNNGQPCRTNPCDDHQNHLGFFCYGFLCQKLSATVLVWDLPKWF